MLDPLPAGTYAWRVRAAAGDATVTSPTFTFNIAVALPPPVLVFPASALLIGHLNQPITLIVQNPVPSPPVSGITNSFDVATDSAFANNDLVLRLTLAADRVSGSIISNQSHPSSFAPSSGLPFVVVLISKSIANTSIFYAPGDATPVDTVGSVSTDGRVTGAFDGYLAAEYINPMFRCSGHFIWSLAPR